MQECRWSGVFDQTATHGSAQNLQRSDRRQEETERPHEHLLAPPHVIHPENERSRRVATKLGMVVETEVANPRLGRLVEVWSSPPGSSSDG